jgi:hypothetical protein
MEKAYWLGRKRASLKMARDAVSSQARLVHYDLAGRYSLNAASATTQTVALADSLPPPIYIGGALGPSDETGDA